ncbi:hypothetical protein KSP39_PZI002772 [Platanthera zijinensis]|uniref:Uncharacterized protein n=1 Tax=Platanthera zijinensis TaxID=2320716 RepID=A0AAP0GE03_9ASPA
MLERSLKSVAGVDALRSGLASGACLDALGSCHASGEHGGALGSGARGGALWSGAHGGTLGSGACRGALGCGALGGTLGCRAHIGALASNGLLDLGDQGVARFGRLNRRPSALRRWAGRPRGCLIWAAKELPDLGGQGGGPPRAGEVLPPLLPAADNQISGHVRRRNILSSRFKTLDEPGQDYVTELQPKHRPLRAYFSTEAHC